MTDTTDIQATETQRNGEAQRRCAPALGSASWGGVSVLNADCMDVMSKLADNSYDLAICDPEYGINLKGPCGRFERYGTLQSVNSKPPTAEYFVELRRVSRWQIIWGGNYFPLPPCQAYIIWDKQQPEGVTFADSEYAWTNLGGVARTFRCRPQNADDDGRIHPTQKPVKLYKWLLTKYAQPGWRILDTHLGSGSSAIAALELKYELLGCEISEQYFATAVERIGRYKQQGVLL